MSDALTASYFSLHVDGITGNMTYHEINGLGFTMKTIENPSTDVRGQVIIRRQAGDISFKSCTIATGVVSDDNLLKWFKAVIDEGKPDKRKAIIYAYSRDHKQVAAWELEETLPESYQGPAEGADSNNIAVNKLSFKYSNYQRVQP